MITQNNILFDVQKQIANIIREDEQLSSMTWLEENRRDIDFEIKNALGKQGIVGLITTPNAEYIGDYNNQSLVWEINPLEIDIVENVAVNRSFNNSLSITGQDASMRLFDVLCPQNKDSREGQISPIGYEQGEDNSLIVNKCTFKCYVKNSSESPEPPKPYFAQPDSLSIVLGNIDENGFLSSLGKQTNRTNLVFKGLKGLDDGAFIYKFARYDIQNEDPYTVYNVFQNNISSIHFPDLEEMGVYAMYHAYEADEALEEVEFPNRTINLLAMNQNKTPMGFMNFDSTFKFCENLKTVSKIDVNCGSSAQRLFNETFYYCDIRSLDIALHAENLNNSYATNRTFYHMAYNCQNLSSLNIKIDVPGDLRINEEMFRAIATNRSLGSYTIDFSTCTKVPVLDNINAFTHSSYLTCYIKVPESLYDEWINATNWNTLTGVEFVV